MLHSPPPPVNRNGFRVISPNPNGNGRQGYYQPQPPGPDLELPLPHSPEAEEAVLGALLLDRDTILTVAPQMRPEHFFSQPRANLYRAILNLYTENTPADMVTVRDALRAMGALGEDEGQVPTAYLLKLLNATPSPVHVGYHIEIVQRYWLARQLISECSSTISRAYLPAAPVMDEEEEFSPGELLAQHSTRLQELAASMTSFHPSYYMSHEKALEYVSRLKEEREKLAQANSAPGGGEDPWELDSGIRPGLRWGWPVFDGQDGEKVPVLCLLPATLTTVLGRTGGGKTIIAMQVADTNAQVGLNVLYFHVELNQEQMMARRLCRWSSVPVLNQLRPRNLTYHEVGLLEEADRQIKSWPGRVDFVSCPNWGSEKLVQEIKARHFALMASTGHGYDLVVLDYLQRLGRSEKQNRAAEHEVLGANVRAFSDCLNELNIAGLMTSQVGRADGSAQYEPPDISEGLGSGEIERCSNQLLALAVSEDRMYVKYAIRKNTFGEAGASGELQYDSARLQFL